MNINEQVARRRAELKRTEEQAAADRRAAEAAGREAAKEDIAARLRSEAVPVTREGGKLVIERPPPPPIDVAGMEAKEVEQLLRREARRRWTPEENWVVIGSIAAGAALLHLGGLGLIPLAFGAWRHSVLVKKYREEVLAEYPQLAPPAT